MRGFKTFPKDNNPKVNIIALLEFELTNFETADQQFSYYTIGAPQNRIHRFFIGVLMMDDICALSTVEWYLLLAFPFLSSNNLDSASLKPIQIQIVSSLRPFKIHLVPGTDVDWSFLTIQKSGY